MTTDLALKEILTRHFSSWR